MGRGVDRHPTAHAVADDHQAPGVDAQGLGVLRIAHIGQGRIGVLQVLREAEDTGAAPGAAIIDGDHVPPGPADGLGQVQVLLVAGQAVEQDHGGMLAGPGGQIGDAIDLHPMAGNVQHLHARRMGRVRGRVGIDRRRNLAWRGRLGGAGGQQKGGGEAGQDRRTHHKTPSSMRIS